VGWPCRLLICAGVRDAYCTVRAMTVGRTGFAMTGTCQALRVDARTDPGAYLNEVRIVKRDNTGRAENLQIAVSDRRLVRAGISRS